MIHPQTLLNGPVRPFSKPLFIGIDFDGTVVYHEYPDVGFQCPGAVETLKELIAAGHQLILFTMRDGKYLQDAVDFFTEHKIKLFGVNINPTQVAWTDSPKAYCHIYIDDAALGCPLCAPRPVCSIDRPYVDWTRVREILVESLILPAPSV